MTLLQTLFFVLVAEALADDDWLTRVSTYTVAYGNSCGCPTLPAGFYTSTVAATTSTTMAQINRRRRSADVDAVAIIPKVSSSSCALDCTCPNYNLNNCTCGSKPNTTSCYCTHKNDPYKTCYCANNTIMCPIINGPSNCHYLSCDDSSNSTKNTTSSSSNATNTTDSYTNCTYSGSCVVDCTCPNYNLNNCTCGNNASNTTSCYCTHKNDPHKTCYCSNSSIMCPIINGPPHCHYVRCEEGNNCSSATATTTTNTTYSSSNATNTTDSYTNCTYSGSCVVDCTCPNYNLNNCTCGNNASATTSCYCKHKNDPHKTCYCSNSSIMCPIINGPPHCHYVRCEDGNNCSSETNTTHSSSNCKCIYAWKPVTYNKPLIFHTRFRITNIACNSSITTSGTASYKAYRTLIIQVINSMFSVSFGAKYFKSVDSDSITFSCGSLVVDSNVNFNGAYFTSDQVTTMMSDSLPTVAAAYNLTADANNVSSSSVSSTSASATSAAIVTTKAAQGSGANSLKAHGMSIVVTLLEVLGLLQFAR